MPRMHGRNFLAATLGLGASFAVAALALACGGDKPEAKPPTGAAPGAESTPGAGAGSSGGAGDNTGAGNPANAGNQAGSTTTALPQGGELQGAKLGSSTHQEASSKGDGGATVPRGTSANEPGRSAKDYETIIKLRRDEARACYDKALASHPGITGDLVVKWTIDPEGNVTEASVDTTKSSILEPSVGTCVVDIVKKIKFAASPKGFESHASYPFHFTPGGAPGGAKKDAGAGK